MGIETAIFVSLIAAQAISQVSNASSQAKVARTNALAKSSALKQEGDLAVSEKAKEIKLRGARQTSSFITSGLTMEGTPMDVLNETFDVGIADIQNIGRNYQTNRENVLRGGAAESSSIINAGRTEAIGTIASGAGSYAGGSGAGAMFGAQGGVSRTAAFGSPSGVGPIKGFGGF
jgi:hypothetical protein